MAGIYIHIPFCKQACYYCDFHFSTSLKKKPELVDAICKELILRKNEALNEIETIYLGGGTPSLLSVEELNRIFKTIHDHYSVIESAEVTLEANPDDLSEEKIKALAQTSINRLSIGIQSFFEADLVWMNRSHNAEQAQKAIEIGKKYFDNISIDLIYGVPGMSDEKWKTNLEKVLSFKIPHISSYALTVEPRTALAKMIELHKKQPIDDAAAKRHYEILVETLTQAGYVNYEFSNFGLEGYFSQNNTAYWSGKSYLGIGPSAHGFDGEHRYWNVMNNTKYIQSIGAGELPQEQESLTAKDRYNEYIMTGLRTMWGVSGSIIQEKFGTEIYKHFLKEAEKLMQKELIIRKEDRFHICAKGKFLGDGISSELFFVG